MKTTINWAKVDKEKFVGHVLAVLFNVALMASQVLMTLSIIREEALTVFIGIIMILAFFMWFGSALKNIRCISGMLKDARSD